eukprot:TRINITY_DN63_c0_g3_i1.p1 TRINITY_DN63_c0_g3~~TRINITY_DN63_c0_g3_i1.p1  ORF type:complete len:524 (+),score=117.05 TRINITY_DN63_c0_g3_i1:52-1623(+)
MKVIILLVVVLAFVMADPTLVSTKYGKVQGYLDQDAVIFKGIPYAAPPVGNLRWSEPQTPSPWSGIKQTTVFSPGCPQECLMPPESCPTTTSEDCLYLNVFAPRYTNSTVPLPVMVFFPGGYFMHGSASCTLFEAGLFAARAQVILVTTNYRLGFLGFLTTSNTVKGNFGFLDQILVLNWVKENIANFNGNPNKVTIFGQSAGGSSIRAHLISPLSKGLYNQAIILSDPVSLPFKSQSEATMLGNQFELTIGCKDDLHCLRSQNISKVLQAQKALSLFINIDKLIHTFLPLAPVVDGKIIPNYFFNSIPKGSYNHVPLIVGTTKKDGLMFPYLALNSSMNSLEYYAFVAAFFGTSSPQILPKYPPADGVDKRPLVGSLLTDYVFECSSRWVIDTMSAQSDSPIYRYRWDHAMSWGGWPPARYNYCNGEACHGAELPFIFLPPTAVSNFTSNESILSATIVNYFSNFAWNGNPNGSGGASGSWPRWSKSTSPTMQFQTPTSSPVNGLDSPICGLWDSLGYKFGW